MARKDEILASFLAHPLLSEKYELTGPFPKTVREAMNSEVAIVATIARIVEDLETSNATSDAALYKKIAQYLNTIAL